MVGVCIPPLLNTIIILAAAKSKVIITPSSKSFSIKNKSSFENFALNLCRQVDR